MWSKLCVRNFIVSNVLKQMSQKIAVAAECKRWIYAMLLEKIIALFNKFS